MGLNGEVYSRFTLGLGGREGGRREGDFLDDNGFSLC
jgi:hypothetical protein